MQYSYIFGAVCIVIGLFLAFLGRKLFTVALFICATILTAGLILIIFYATFLSDNTASWLGWLMLSLSIVIGLGVGFLATKLEKLGACLLAAWGGFCAGVLLNETVLYLASSVALFWCINVGFAVVAGILGFIFFNQALIVSTSLVGSYLAMRGIGLYAGGFPNEYVLINQLETGEMSNIDPVFYAYLTGIVIMTVIGSIVQFKMLAKMEAHEQHPYNRLA